MQARNKHKIQELSQRARGKENDQAAMHSNKSNKGKIVRARSVNKKTNAALSCKAYSEK